MSLITLGFIYGHNGKGIFAHHNFTHAYQNFKFQYRKILLPNLSQIDMKDKGSEGNPKNFESSFHCNNIIIHTTDTIGTQ